MKILDLLLLITAVFVCCNVVVRTCHIEYQNP
jgi:hypothetical protein